MLLVVTAHKSTFTSSCSSQENIFAPWKYFVIAVSGRAASPIINIINRLYIAICWINCSDVTALSASLVVLTKTPSNETDFICFSAQHYYRLQTCMQQRRKVFSAGERFRGLGKILIPRWNLIWNIDMDHSVSLSRLTFFSDPQYRCLT